MRIEEGWEMQIDALMTRDPVAVPPTTAVLDARRLMQERRIRHLLVLEGDRLVGIVTDRDIRLNLPSPATSLSVWEVNYLLGRLTVGEVMSTPVITVGPTRNAAEAARIMLEHTIGALPVVENGRPLGIVTETDMLRAFVAMVERQDSR
jgi:acetoin utilization protein AcuB